MKTPRSFEFLLCVQAQYYTSTQNSSAFSCCRWSYPCKEFLSSLLAIIIVAIDFGEPCELHVGKFIMILMDAARVLIKHPEEIVFSTYDDRYFAVLIMPLTK